MSTDNRPTCKYGSLCYQKNAAHHEKFKHPWKQNIDKVERVPPTKKFKYSSQSSKSPTAIVNDDKYVNTITAQNNKTSSDKSKNEEEVKESNSEDHKDIVGFKNLKYSPQSSKSPTAIVNDDKYVNTTTAQNNKTSSDKSKNEEVKESNSEDHKDIVGFKNLKYSPQSSKSPTTIVNDDKYVNTITAQNNKTSSDKSKNEKEVKESNSEDHKDIVKQLFLVNMPTDFYSFWEFCKSLNKENPSDALKDVKLELVGAFDVLAGKVTNVDENQKIRFLRHWRYYYDPPEMQTVIRGDDSKQYHMGYFRDVPSEDPVFVASNCLDSKKPDRNGIIKPMGDNLFAAVNQYLDSFKDGDGDPFIRMKVPKIQKALIAWAQDKNFNLSKSSPSMQARQKKIVTKTFHGAGLVIPVDKKNDVGYRELAETDTMIKKILKNIVESKDEEERRTFFGQLQPVITFANIANDECDFGTSLELGLDLFTFGTPLLHRSIKQLLKNAYNLLGRQEFAQIIEVHLEDRKNSTNLSVI